MHRSFKWLVGRVYSSWYHQIQVQAGHNSLLTRRRLLVSKTLVLAQKIRPKALRARGWVSFNLCLDIQGCEVSTPLWSSCCLCVTVTAHRWGLFQSCLWRALSQQPPQDFNPHFQPRVCISSAPLQAEYHFWEMLWQFLYPQEKEVIKVQHGWKQPMILVSSPWESENSTAFYSFTVFFFFFWNPKILRKCSLIWLWPKEMRGRNSFEQNNLWIYQQLEEGCGICPHSFVFLLGFLSAGNGKYSLKVWNDWKNVSEYILGFNFLWLISVVKTRLFFSWLDSSC